MLDIPDISAITAVLLPSIFHTGHTVARMSVNDLYTTFGLLGNKPLRQISVGIHIYAPHITPE